MTKTELIAWLKSEIEKAECRQTNELAQESAELAAYYNGRASAFETVLLKAIWLPDTDPDSSAFNVTAPDPDALSPRPAERSMPI